MLLAGSFPTRPPRLSESDGGQVIQAGDHPRIRYPYAEERAVFSRAARPP